MNYKKRNTIVIGIFVLLVGLAGSYYVFFNFPKKVNKIKTEIQDVDQKITALQGLEMEIENVEAILEDQKSRLKKLDKQLAVSGSPAETYRYINSIMNYSGVLKVDLLFLTNKVSENFIYDVYRIKGEGFFPTIYKFLWYLERGPEIYKIKKVGSYFMTF